MRVLERGGNAIDAGVATGLCINVAQPDMTNLGGVAPIIVYLAKTREVLTISVLGWWPRAASIQWFADRGFTSIPTGVESAVVPSAVDAWLTALARYGRRTLAEVAAPAIELAEHGFPVNGYLRRKIESHSTTFLASSPTLRNVFMPSGRVPEEGELLVQRDLGQTLRKLVEAEAAAAHLGREGAIMAARDRFYHGDIAEQIVDFCQEHGGMLTMEDMAEFSVAVEPPVQTTYRGYEVYACGPWCQGPVVPQALNILEGFDLAALGHNSSDYLHTVAEALKLAFSDRHAYFGDPRFVRVPMDGLLDKAYAASRRALIDPRRAWPAMPPPGDAVGFETGSPERVRSLVEASARDGPAMPDTSYLCVIDADGNAFSATPSDGLTGTPIVAGLGIIISARGSQSWLEPEHPSAVAPGKRPRLTPSPGMVLQDGQLFMPYGTPGGDVQPQAMLQCLLNMIDFGLNPQQAVEAPRISTASHPDSFDPHPCYPGRLNAEARIDASTLADLAARGHKVEVWPAFSSPGRTPGNLCGIKVDRQHGVLMAAADPRGVAYALGW